MRGSGRSGRAVEQTSEHESGRSWLPGDDGDTRTADEGPGLRRRRATQCRIHPHESVLQLQTSSCCNRLEFTVTPLIHCKVWILARTTEENIYLAITNVSRNCLVFKDLIVCLALLLICVCRLLILLFIMLVFCLIRCV